MARKFFAYLLKNQVIFALFLVAAFLLVVEARLLLFIFFFGFVIMSAFSSSVDFFTGRGLPKFLAISLVYLPIVGVLALAAAYIIPGMISQLGSLGQNFPEITNNLFSPGFGFDLRSYLTSLIDNLSGQVVTFFGNAVHAVWVGVAILVVSIYMLASRGWIYDQLTTLLPISRKSKMAETWYAVEQKLGRWVRGQLLLSVFVGGLTWIFLLSIGFKFAAGLALIAALLEFIPFLGPIIAAVPAVLIALNDSFTQAIVVTLGYVAIQQIEGNLLHPNIMRKAVNLHPLVIIAAVILGGELWGVWGVLIAVPLATAVKVFLTHTTGRVEVDKK